MKEFKSEHKALTIDDFRKLRGHKLDVLRRSIKKIPMKPGVYVWRYWPSFTSLDKDLLIEKIKEIQNVFPRQFETLGNSRVKVTIERTPFGGACKEDTLLGIKVSNKKIDSLIRILDKSEDTRLRFLHTIEVMLSSAPPIYIGKADNLRNRLEQHFENKTDLLNRINEAGVPHHDIYISFLCDEISDEDNGVTTAIEEILQRLTNPPLTKRYG